jgi:hypothetical protein
MSRPRRMVCLSLMLCWSCALAGCPSEVEGLTDPCASGCSASATVGAPCGAAEDCAEGDACRLTFPGGYCEGICTDSAADGTLCGSSDGGLCVDIGGESGVVCLASCETAEPASCGRPSTVCYELASSPALGVCFGRCTANADCGQGFACDGQGLCRPAVATCDGLTDEGCREGTRCYLSADGVVFCGLAGDGLVGDACDRVAACQSGHWCLAGVCRASCDVRDLSSCGNLPAACTPLQSGSRLGFCIL